MASKPVLIQITCPHCDEREEIVANPVPDRQLVRCSRCHRMLGIWHGLVVIGERTRLDLDAWPHPATSRPGMPRLGESGRVLP
jgi:hypothetical protein